MSKKSRRFIQIYTGNGKGKTTAAVGQAVRAAGHGLKTLIIAFMKEYPYGEFRSLSRLKDYITVEPYGGDAFVYEAREPSQEDKAPAQKALARATDAMHSGEYDIVVLDEVCVAVYFHLLTADEVLPLLTDKPDSVELVLTGRYCPTRPTSSPSAGRPNTIISRESLPARDSSREGLVTI